MAKRALYSRDDILSAAISAVGRRGHAATVADVTHELGAPSGSIYHRFPTRESLFASAWIRCVHRFHDTFAAITDVDDPLEAIVETGLLIPRFCREIPTRPGLSPSTGTQNCSPTRPRDCSMTSQDSTIPWSLISPNSRDGASATSPLAASNSSPWPAARLRTAWCAASSAARSRPGSTSRSPQRSPRSPHWILQPTTELCTSPPKTRGASRHGCAPPCLDAPCVFR